MKVLGRVLTAVMVATLFACSRSEAPVPAAPADVPSTMPAAEGSTPEAADTALPPELAARLTRPHSPVLGPGLAPVTIVEFLDPACEACRAFAPVVKQILFLHPNDVRVVIRYAAFHQGSDEAVRLLDAAHRQGKFEAVLNALFDGQAQWASHHAPDVQQAWTLAAAAGLDMSRARRDARSPQADEVLRIDAEDVVALRVDRTPTFFVNGRRLEDFGAEQLMRLVSDEIARAQNSQP